MGIKDCWAHGPRMSLKLQRSAGGGGHEGEEGGLFGKGPSKAGFIRAAACVPESPLPPTSGQRPFPSSFSCLGKKKKERKKERRGGKTQQQSLSHSSEVIENKLLPHPPILPPPQFSKCSKGKSCPGNQAACSDLQPGGAVAGLAGCTPSSGGTRTAWGAWALMLFQREESPSRSGPP